MQDLTSPICAPLHWKCGDLTTGPQGKSWKASFKSEISTVGVVREGEEAKFRVILQFSDYRQAIHQS